MLAEQGEDPRQLRDILLDPVRFTRGFLRHDVWSTQAAILQSVATARRTAVKACHASGKSFVSAAAALWWVTRHPNGVVITTAPTWTQVERVLWGEIRKAASRSRIAYPPFNQTELKLGPNNYAIGLSTNEGVRFQGFHGCILIILDEAPGVMPEIWEAIEGIRAGGDVRVLALGNPTIASGPFYDAFTSNRDGWNTFTISAFDTPNLAGLSLEHLLALPDAELDRNARSYLVSRRWVREKYSEWGPGHPLWESRVLGQFPTQAEDALISLAWIEQASQRPVVRTQGKLRAGLDVAGPGDDETVLYIVDGPSVVLMKAWKQQDPRGDVVAALMPYKNRLEAVNVDSAGIGHYMARHLEDLGFHICDVNVGRSARDSDKYANLKAERYWGLRLRFEQGEAAGLVDERTIAQLAGIRYSHDARGRVKIESKEDARKRGVKSPDRAEALMLAWTQAPEAVQFLYLDASSPPALRPTADALVREVFPTLFLDDPDSDYRPSCGGCVHWKPEKRTSDGGVGRCTLRLFGVDAETDGCDYHELAAEE